MAKVTLRRCNQMRMTLNVKHHLDAVDFERLVVEDFREDGSRLFEFGSKYALPGTKASLLDGIKTRMRYYGEWNERKWGDAGNSITRAQWKAARNYVKGIFPELYEARVESIEENIDDQTGDEKSY